MVATSVIDKGFAMKNLLFRIIFSLVAVFFAPLVHATTFTNFPTVVSNTYTGSITLQVSNLPTGDTVVIQKFLDVNTNGIIDAADLLVQQFSLTDGQPGQVIGGVTNFNVPGDLGSPTGMITATLSFNNGDFMQNLAGTYLYRVTSPTGHFNAKTNSLVVTNFPFGQSFSGSVVSNSTATTVPNAVVVLFPPPRSGHNGPGQPLGGTVANSAGLYSISAPAGTYTLLAFGSNYVANFSKAPVVTLNSGGNVSTNLSMTNATLTISGSIVDAASPGTVLPGVFTPLSSTNGLLMGTFSDTNGNFSARVTGGQWSVGSDDAGLIVHGYVGFQNGGTNVVAPAAGVVLAFPKATALFYGVVTNSQGNPLVGIDINDNDTVSNLYGMDGYTDASGKYYVGAVATGSNDPWQLGPSSESTGVLTNYIISQPPFTFNGGTNMTVGLAVAQDFLALLATNTIRGTVKDTGNNPISGVQVYAYAQINGFNFQPQTNTDNSGNYALQVANGFWNLSVYCGGGQGSLPNNYACPSQVNLNIANNNVVTNFVVQSCSGVTITTASPLPVGEVGQSYFQGLNASSCNPSFTWTNTSGTLPPGVSFYNNGQLSGTPTTNGVYVFTVQVTDGNSAMTNKQFSLTVYTNVQVTTANLPNGTNGSAYNAQLQATGGQIFGGGSPYSWTLSPGSFSLPANLNLATNGVISGSAATSGLFNFSVRATDVAGGFADRALSITLIATNSAQPPPVGIVSASGGQMLVYYPANGSNFILQTATNVNGPWVTASNGVPAISLFFTNTVPAQFFRLH
jgi:hypothetical protein